MKKKKTINSDEFDRLFDAGHDISDWLDPESMVSTEQFIRQMRHITLPDAILQRLDTEAAKSGLERNALAAVFIAERLGMVTPPPT
jgi:hypothetical protein